MSEQNDREVTCVYCGQAYPAGTPTHGAAVLTDHIKVCEKHPMRQAEETIKRLEREIQGLTGQFARLPGAQAIVDDCQDRDYLYNVDIAEIIVDNVLKKLQS